MLIALGTEKIVLVWLLLVEDIASVWDSTNHCIAREFTNHYTDIISKKLLPNQYIYIGDEGFINTNNFVAPISGAKLSPCENGFNYHLSRMRQNVE